MLIKALTEYYEAQEKNGTVRIPGHLSKQHIHYMIFLTPTGEISQIADVKVKREEVLKNGKKKTVTDPIYVLLPKRSQKTSIDLNIIEHRPLYIFGLNCEKGVFTTEDKTEKAKKSHARFVEGNLEFCKGLDSEIGKAYCAFLEKWDAQAETENVQLLSIAKDYATSYFCFALDGHPDIRLHEDAQLLRRYEEAFAQKELQAEGEKNLCPVEGVVLPVARLHDNISGIKGANSNGCVLVGVNETAFESYGQIQSYTSGISTKAMKKYTAALNELLKSPSHRLYVGEMTVVYFALSEQDEEQCDLFYALLNGENKMQGRLQSVMREVLAGRAGDIAAMGVDEKADFVVLGLAPNSSRISQKFMYQNQFGSMIQNLVQHQRDIQVRADGAQVALWQIYKQLVSPKSTTQKVSPPLSAALFQAILHGRRYPVELLYTVVHRIKTDQDDDKDRFIKINDVRIGLLKAYLNRQARIQNKEEEIKLALDKENKNQAYLCGRLFAVIEYLQQRSAGSALNTTVKTSYFAAACARPASVFPKLLRQAQNYMAKMESGGYWNKQIGDIVQDMDGAFPCVLSYEDQGVFIIGYYHQNSALYTSKEKREQESERSEHESEVRA